MPRLTPAMIWPSAPGIDGTPTFIVNGVMHPGAVDDATLADLASKEG